MKNSQVLSLLLCYNFEKEFKIFSDKFIIKIDEVKYPNKMFYFIEDKCFIIYNLYIGYIWCKYSNFWRYFESKFYFNYDQIKYLIKFMFKKQFRLSDVRPKIWNSFNRYEIEKHFNK